MPPSLLSPIIALTAARLAVARVASLLNWQLRVTIVVNSFFEFLLASIRSLTIACGRYLCDSANSGHLPANAAIPSKLHSIAIANVRLGRLPGTVSPRVNLKCLETIGGCL